MSKISGAGQTSINPGQTPDMGQVDGAKDKGKFGRTMSKAADGALATVATVAPVLPGGQLIGMAANGLRELKGGSPQGLSGNQPDQMDKMWAMQKENQVFNLQYMQLQNEVQADNRRFSTLSNLMKVRHDTAKSAINNMHA
ncbi:MAG: hypothetical protein ACNA8W_10940 [Bradymonadaceae bacterium]